MAKNTHKCFVQMFTVKGNGDFPLDMLRYDVCFPKTELDAHKLTHSDNREITFIRHSKQNDNPSYQRWLSFRWEVIDIKTIFNHD